MEKQKKNESGITLVALVVSIIVMLVLAGVSLNATIGDNGIVTRAQEAALQQRIATELENLNLELTKLNVDTITTDEAMAIQDIANYLVGKGTIDSFITTSAGQIAAGIDTSSGNKYFFGTKGDNTYRIIRGTDGLLKAELTTQTSGGDITGGYALITADSFNNDTSLPETEKGKFTITSDAEVVFMDTITGALSIYVADNVHATVGIYANMTLTNQGIKRSAIDISKNNGVLDLYIGDGVEVTVNSGYGEEGETATGMGAKGGPGGYAGIHVPEGAVLNMFGSGKIKAIGGRAGDGAGAYSGDTGGGGGGGAGAGIGGNGGNGGGANGSRDDLLKTKDYGLFNSGVDGEPGENCGIINIHNTVEVYAYGGGGGSALFPEEDASDNSGGGAGGYPGAGIGGGGAGGGGGDHANAGGGYTGASGEVNHDSVYNGEGGVGVRWGGGGSYFEQGRRTVGDWTGLLQGVPYAVIGGQGGTREYDGIHDTNCYRTSGGDGGIAGKGGIVRASESAKTKLHAFNGNKYTDNLEIHNYNNGQNQLEIDAQKGVLRAVYKYNFNWTKYDLRTYSYYENFLGNTINSEIKNEVRASDTYSTTEGKNLLLRKATTCETTSYGQGIGSGAGYIEISNGTYNEYKENSLGQFVDSNGNVIQ